MVVPPRSPRPDLAAELRRRVERDQQVRAVPDKSPADLARWREVDADNARWMRRVLREHGWPGRSLVGEQGCADAAVLVQHADTDRALQATALELMIESVDAGDADAAAVAYLADRLSLHRGAPQRYGTQYARDATGVYRMLPVEDPAGLDERRRALGLGTVAEFEHQLVEMHGSGVVAAGR